MRLAILGTGSSGIFTLATLVKYLKVYPTLKEQIESITIVKSEPVLGDPRAFGEHLPEQFILNTCDQSLDPYLPEWLEFRVAKGLFQSVPSPLLKTYSCRAHFGVFLNEFYQNTLAQLRRFFVVHEFVDEPSKFEISDENTIELCVQKRVIYIDKIILCMGSGRTRQVSSSETSDPYSFANEIIPNKASVGIIGSGLSAVDALIHLEKTGHNGQILVVSRTARLPRVQSPHDSGTESVKIEPQYNLSKETTLKHFWDWMSDEFDRANIPRNHVNNLFCREITTAASWGHEIHDANTKPRLWQERSFFLTSYMADFWINLNATDKTLFLNQFRSVWISNLVAMPYKNALSIKRLFEKGNLTFMFGDEKNIQTEYTIDATPYGLSRGELNPLIKFMINTGLASIDELGSLLIDWNSMAILPKKDKKNDGVIYYIGEAALGPNFVTGSIEENIKMARKAVANIFGHVIPKSDVL